MYLHILYIFLSSKSSRTLALKILFRSSLQLVGLFCLYTGSCCIRHLLPDARGCCVSSAMSAEAAGWAGACFPHA